MLRSKSLLLPETENKNVVRQQLKLKYRDKQTIKNPHQLH